MNLPATLIVVSTLAAPPGAAQAARPHPVVRAAVSRLLEETPRLPVWVFFTDKGAHSEQDRQAALNEARSRLSPRAILRRDLRRSRPGVVDDQDAALCEQYVQAVLDTGASLRARSRWLNAASVEAGAAQVARIAALPFVAAIEPVRSGCPQEAVPVRPSRDAAPRPQAEGPGFYGSALDQLDQVGITDMHAAGFTGAGVVIGVLDTGFLRSHDAYNAPGHALDVAAEWDFVDGDADAGVEAGDPGDQHWHGTIVLAVIGGYQPGAYVGGAYDASFILAKTEDTTGETEVEEDYYVAGLEFIEAGGADVATSSLGYDDWYTWFDMDGLTAVTTIAVNTATANGLACCTAAGNGSIDQDLPSLDAPGDAFDVVTCGAADAAGAIAEFSSNGPTFDGRVKPEVLARGVSTASIDPDDDAGFLEADGTSMSTPLVAAAVSLLIDAHPQWTIPQIREALFSTADYFVANGAPDPEFRRGYGVIDVFAASVLDFCTADLDGGGDVGVTDLLILLATWGPCAGCAGDLDGDGIAGVEDLLALLAAWGLCP